MYLEGSRFSNRKKKTVKGKIHLEQSSLIFKLNIYCTVKLKFQYNGSIEDHAVAKHERTTANLTAWYFC